MFVYYLTDLFLFRFVVTEKYKCIKAIENVFYQKIIEASCSGNFNLKAGYIAEEKRVWRFSVNKNYCIKDIINKINGEKEKRIACTKYFLRGCSYENSFPVVFPLNWGNTYYFPEFICQMFPRLGEI